VSVGMCEVWGGVWLAWRDGDGVSGFCWDVWVCLVGVWVLGLVGVGGVFGRVGWVFWWGGCGGILLVGGLFEGGVGIFNVWWFCWGCVVCVFGLGLLGVFGD